MSTSFEWLVRSVTMIRLYSYYYNSTATHDSLFKNLKNLIYHCSEILLMKRGDFIQPCSYIL